MTRTALALARELYAAAAEADRCPYLGAPGRPSLAAPGGGAYCGTPTLRFSLTGGGDREAVCDTASLQLWCLAGSDRWPKCIFYPKPRPAA